MENTTTLFFIYPALVIGLIAIGNRFEITFRLTRTRLFTVCKIFIERRRHLNVLEQRERFARTRRAYYAVSGLLIRLVQTATDYKRGLNLDIPHFGKFIQHRCSVCQEIYRCNHDAARSGKFTRSDWTSLRENESVFLCDGCDSDLLTESVCNYYNENKIEEPMPQFQNCPAFHNCLTCGKTYKCRLEESSLIYDVECEVCREKTEEIYFKKCQEEFYRDYFTDVYYDEEAEENLEYVHDDGSLRSRRWNRKMELESLYDEATGNIY